MSGSPAYLFLHEKIIMPLINVFTKISTTYDLPVALLLGFIIVLY